MKEAKDFMWAVEKLKQGLKGNMERSVIPPSLFEEIFNSIKKGVKK